jgi:ABC-type bacteriocin/lantibiotic exporter with double-glycine peptidase domain
MRLLYGRAGRLNTKNGGFRPRRAVRKEQMKQTDLRSKQITEVLSSIRIIKFMSWEQRFIEKVTGTRDKELVLYMKQQVTFSA